MTRRFELIRSVISLSKFDFQNACVIIPYFFPTLKEIDSKLSPLVCREGGRVEV
jgi:hypothetical protein